MTACGRPVRCAAEITAVETNKASQVLTKRTQTADMTRNAFNAARAQVRCLRTLLHARVWRMVCLKRPSIERTRPHRLPLHVRLRSANASALNNVPQVC